ncbi:hypothetical protein [Sphingomonas abietis]|uniref:Uncharacterized protein n=1 Tax=Sphingomonas abietis TaxID=3012344 RepID=A0ABY7NK71_9SPHN|nr:hypothetical protein [Sphingomonas abietis]WBO21738.1 hypothetical protein PBT88_16425 [Sphingomonas abietis]
MNATPATESTQPAAAKPERKHDDLKAEYLLIQGQYEAFDQRALGMKALATPLLGAGLAAGTKEGSPAILWATILVAVSLWLLEGIWKGFQKNLAGRIEALEAWYRGEGEDDLAPFQIYSWWNAVPWKDRFWYVTTRLIAPFIALPYAAVIVVCFIGLFANLYVPK